MQLSGWNSLAMLATTCQPEDTLESDQYDKFKTIVKVCKASGVNFSVLCSTNIDMAIAELNSTSEIKKTGTYKSGVYFKVEDSEMNVDDDRANKTCISTRFLSLT